MMKHVRLRLICLAVISGFLLIYTTKAEIPMIVSTAIFEKDLTSMPLYDDVSIDREYSFIVPFSGTFGTPPQVAVSIVGLEVEGTDQDIYFEAQSITTSNFGLYVRVSPPTILTKFRICFLASIWSN